MAGNVLKGCQQNLKKQISIKNEIKFKKKYAGHPEIWKCCCPNHKDTEYTYLLLIGYVGKEVFCVKKSILVTVPAFFSHSAR